MNRRALSSQAPGRRAWVLPLLLALAGCSSTWAPRTLSPEAALQWPPAPAPAKVGFVQSLSGFTPETSARTVLESVVFGSDSEEKNAFVLPVAVAVGRDERIAVADLGRRCVHLYLPQSRSYLRLTGAKERPIGSPVGVAFDDTLRLYLTDSSGAVFVFAADGSPERVLTHAGSEPLQRPTGIAFSRAANLLYVTDTLAQKVHALRIPTGEVAFSFGGRGIEPGRFNFPTHLFDTTAGELYVADALNFRIAIFDEKGTFLRQFGHHGDGWGDLAMPKGVAADNHGVVYVADAMFDNVQLFSATGDFLLTLGQRGVGFGEFWLPAGLFLDHRGRLYVCDTYNHRIQIFQIREGYDGAS